jgi:hypothetical protein
MASNNLTLSASASMTGGEYQSQWGSVSDADATVSDVPLRALPSSTDEIENVLAAVNIMTMASGELPNEFKFFLYAKDSSSGATIMIQTNVDKSSPSDAFMIATIKIGGPCLDPTGLAEQVIQIMRMQLS